MASKKARTKKKKPAERSRSHPVQFYLYESELADLRAICAERKRSMSEQLRLWVCAVMAARRGVDPRQAGLF